MGQYHIVVNVTKRQYLHPHRCGDGLKLLEFGGSGGGTMLALAILLADSNGRGAGDLSGGWSDAERRTMSVEDPYRLIGSWAGDRIVVTGDYGDPGKLYGTELLPKPEELAEDGQVPNLFSYAGKEFCDISLAVRDVLSKAGELMGDRWDTSNEDTFDPNHSKVEELHGIDNKAAPMTADELQEYDDEVRAEDDPPKTPPDDLDGF